MSRAELGRLISPVVKSLGFELLGLDDVHQGKFSILRFYVDSKNGVSIEDCGNISHSIDSVLAVEQDFLSGEYTIEVSSPGLDRRLFTCEQCVKHKGKDVKLRLFVPVDGQRNYKGKLIAVDLELNVLGVCMGDGRELKFNFDDLEKINVVPQW